MNTVRTRTSTRGLHVEVWGEGTPVVLVHGSLATSAEEWEGQRPLVDEGFRFLAPDRRGYGASPAATGEDFLADAEDIAELLGDGAHLVGHSYGGLGALVAASLRPEATRGGSLVRLATVSPSPPQAATSSRAAMPDRPLEVTITPPPVLGLRPCLMVRAVPGSPRSRRRSGSLTSSHRISRLGGNRPHPGGHPPRSETS